MAKTAIDKLGSARRFGSRYGSKPKHIFAKIEKEQRRKHKCPYCMAMRVKRVATGIWHCSRCNTKFTGKAYSINKVVTAEETAEEEVPKPVEEEEDQETQQDEQSAQSDYAQDQSSTQEYEQDQQESEDESEQENEQEDR